MILSKLYNLMPENIGTPFAESLTSYVSRLAWAHNLLPIHLINNLIAPLLGNSYFLPHHLTMSSYYAAGSMNGLGRTASEWVSVLESLTTRVDLTETTFLSYQEILPSKWLTRRNRAWCPYCFETQRCNNTIIYEPLLWKARDVLICPVHSCRLIESCAHCNRFMPHILKASKPGFCFHCGFWLGGYAEQDIYTSNVLLIWQAQQVGELLALASSSRESYSLSRLSQCLKLAIDSIFGGSIAAFSESMHIDRRNTDYWLSQTYKPTLKHLLQLSCGLRISVSDLLSCNFCEPAVELPMNELRYCDGGQSQKQKYINWNVVLSELRRIASGTQTPLALSEFCLKHAIHISSLYKKDSSLCRQVTKAYMASDAHKNHFIRGPVI